MQRQVPLVRALPADLQLELKGLIQVFLAEVAFVGCRGLVVTDAMRVTVAAQACLLLLRRPQPYYPLLRQVLLYPGSFVVQRAQSDGVLTHEEQAVLSGESWREGQVILSWEDSLADSLHPEFGRNVVIHEFAHQLDWETGHANGAPVLPGRMPAQRWSEVLQREFDALRERSWMGLPSLLDTYGASDPGEFFAVASEAFFTRAKSLAQEHTALYGQLSGLYRIHPLSW